MRWLQKTSVFTGLREDSWKNNTSGYTVRRIKSFPVIYTNTKNVAYGGEKCAPINTADGGLRKRSPCEKGERLESILRC
jgi:hypothetical protein